MGMKKEKVIILKNLRRRRVNVAFLSKHWMLYVFFAILIIRQLSVGLQQNTNEFLQLVLMLGAFLLLLLRLTYLPLSMGFDILYLWTFPDSGAPTSNGSSNRNKVYSFKKSILPVEVRHLAQQVYYALYHRHLHLAGLAPPPKSHQLESVLDLKWNVSPYLLRPQDDNEWRDAVKELLTICKGVVVECSSFGKNLEWELIEASKVFSLDRILLVCDQKNRASAEEIRQYLISHASSQSQKKNSKQKLRGKKHHAAGSEPQIVQRSNDKLGENIKMWRPLTQWAQPICNSYPEIIKANKLINRKRLVIEWSFQICVILMVIFVFL